MKPKVIIFGNNLQNTLGLIRSVGMEGYEVILLLEPVKKSLCYVRHSKYITRIHYLNKLEEGLDILINEYGREKQKPIVLCGSDPTIKLLDAHYDELKDKFFIFNAGESGKINYYLDKINTFPIAEECGLTLIKSWYVKDIHNLPEDITFPCLTKGNNSTESTKADMFICNDRKELESCLREGVEYLVQEYIQKEYELDIVGLSYNHGQDVFVPAVVRKIRDDIHRQSGYIRLDDINEYKEFDQSIINRFLKKVGYEGIFSIEVMYSEGKYYFLEINMRNDGVCWLYTAAGINYPYLWTLYNQKGLSHNDLNSIKFKNHLYLMSEGDAYNMIEGKVSIIDWIKDFHRAQAFFIANSKDLMPFIFSTWIHLKQMIKKILRKLFHIKID